uniref:EGF-like domain-containing protein n=1 Tax=Anolis carolinensis TaxID=28377 RepID=A0A803T5U5_ANOCA
MQRSRSSVLLRSVKMENCLQIFCEEAEVLCTGTACYTLDLEKHSWTKAQQMCKNNGGNLMTLKSQEEALIVQQLLNKIPQEGAGTDITTYLMCMPQPNSNISEWSSPGPFCASPAYGCSYSNGGCEHDCLDQSGGLFECSCHSGYQLGGDHLSCIPVDYCISSPCQGKCLPYPGGFTCQCSVGYMLAEDGLNCLDVDECKASSRPCEQICVNTIGSFICRCHQGYKPTEPNGQACQDIDECATLTPCDQVCLNTPGSFLCSCQTGYQLEGINSSSCIDDDECQEEFCEHMCINQPGSYQCSCRPGWILAPNKISCYPDAITSFPPTQKQELDQPCLCIRWESLTIFLKQ